MASNLYRVHYVPHDGYAVYRHCFDESKCNLLDAVTTHETALFVTRMEAQDYANYRNRLIDERGSDVIYAERAIEQAASREG